MRPIYYSRSKNPILRNEPYMIWYGHPAYPFRCMGLRMSGKLSKVGIFKHYRWGNIFTRLYSQVNHRMSKQQGWRSTFYDGMYNWRHFDTATKDFYNSLKFPARMHGVNRYLRYYLKTKTPMKILWSSIDKTISDLADITTKSHTSLTDKGTNTHAQLDSHLGYSAGVHGATGSVLGTTDAQDITNKNLDTTNQISLKSPRGFLLNGKIVPSVAANDLTVAIKGLDGNDPSATNPVYCRIGDTIRAITAALSITKAYGTNWFNSGVAQLATYEIDYFVYLGYNATDGVVLGFARIPYATLYSDFSTSTTNEKYCAISTILNAAAGDEYELIGRFAATLSATANFYWSVPTFTNINLIQRPIFETRLLTWVPTFDTTTVDNGTGGVQPANRSGVYKINMQTCEFNAYHSGIKNGAGTKIIMSSVPFTINEVNYTSLGTGLNASAGLFGEVHKYTSATAPEYYNQASMADNATATSGYHARFTI